jgi:MoxR-like ATPase
VLVRAHPNFRIFATMNPGGDFGKRELSPALRNRFTEVWVPALSDPRDLALILADKAASLSLARQRRMPPAGAPDGVGAEALALRDAAARADEVAVLAAFVPHTVEFLTWFDACCAGGRYTPRGDVQADSGDAGSAGLSSNSNGAGVSRATTPRALVISLRDVHAWMAFMDAVLRTQQQRGHAQGQLADATTPSDAAPACAATDASSAALPSLSPWQAYAHGAAMVILDGLGLGTGLHPGALAGIRRACVAQLLAQAPHAERAAMRAVFYAAAAGSGAPALPGAADVAEEDESAEGAQAADAMQLDAAPVPATAPHVMSTCDRFGVPPFLIPRGDLSAAAAASTAAAPAAASPASRYNFDAPTTRLNLVRVLRAMQLTKPILLEGSPGVGKTSLIESLAGASGHTLVRINLSEQTDLADLFGHDLPASADASAGASAAAGGDGRSDAAPNGGSGSGSGSAFKWVDGVFLKALKAGHWVLLDELNLATQPVLEGLNACLDHRGTVYIPELDATFVCPPTFRVFASQNPASQGGGRKGLPKSFLNRFAKVVVEPLQHGDQYLILRSLFPALDLPLSQLVVGGPAGHPFAAGAGALTALQSGDAAASGDAASSMVAGTGTTLLQAMIAFSDALHADTEGGHRGAAAGDAAPAAAGQSRSKAAAGSDDRSGRPGTGVLYGQSGRPWEFNLRDLSRWCSVVAQAIAPAAPASASCGADAAPSCDATTTAAGAGAAAASMHPELLVDVTRSLDTLYVSRFRSAVDRAAAVARFLSVFAACGAPLHALGAAASAVIVDSVQVRCTANALSVGTVVLPVAAVPGQWQAPSSTRRRRGGRDAAVDAAGCSGVASCLLPLRELQGCVAGAGQYRLPPFLDPDATVAAFSGGADAVIDAAAAAAGSAEAALRLLQQDHFSSVRSTSGSGDALALSRAAAAPFRRALLPTAQHLAACVQHAWPALLVGEQATGRSESVRSLAAACGATLRELWLSPSTDATELLGCFEQVDATRHRAAIVTETLAVGAAVATAAALWSSSGSNPSQLAAVGSTADGAGVSEALATLVGSLLQVRALGGAADAFNSSAAPKDASAASSAPTAALPMALLHALQHAANVAATLLQQKLASTPAADMTGEGVAAAIASAVERAVGIARRVCGAFEVPRATLAAWVAALAPAVSAIASHAGPTAALPAGCAAVLQCAAAPAIAGTSAVESAWVLDPVASAGSTRGGFEWVDGTLVTALIRGEWLLIHDINLCSPAVLDRLNALLEPNGTLLIGESGLDAAGNPRAIVPHPAFRAFFSMSPGLGDVSRALRNRCVEVHVPAAGDALWPEPPAGSPAAHADGGGAGAGVHRKPTHEAASHGQHAAAHLRRAWRAVEAVVNSVLQTPRASAEVAAAAVAAAAGATASASGTGAEASASRDSLRAVALALGARLLRRSLLSVDDLLELVSREGGGYVPASSSAARDSALVAASASGDAGAGGAGDEDRAEPLSLAAAVARLHAAAVHGCAGLSSTAKARGMLPPSTHQLRQLAAAVASARLAPPFAAALSPSAGASDAAALQHNLATAFAVVYGF